MPAKEAELEEAPGLTHDEVAQGQEREAEHPHRVGVAPGGEEGSEGGEVPGAPDGSLPSN